MKKRYLLASVALMMSSLAACDTNNTPSNPDKNLLKVYDLNAKFVNSGYGKDVNGNDEFLPLPTYHHKNNGEAPYVDVAQFFDIANKLFHIRLDYDNMSAIRLPQYDSSIEKIADHLYGIYSEAVLGATMDTKENLFTIYRFDYMFAQSESLNGSLRSDVATPNNGNTSLVHGSSRTTYSGEFQAEEYDLDDYNMDIVEIDDKVYMPAQLLANTVMRGMGSDFAYNGNDFFMTSYIGTETVSAASASFRSSNNTFELNKALYVSATPISGESYRYVANLPIEEGKPATYAIFSLTSDGHGFGFTANSPTAAYSGENADYKLDWVKEDKDVYITLYLKQTSGEFAPIGHMMRVSSNETFFNKKTRSTALSEFNYQLLRFQIENYYGLKEELIAQKGFTDFDSFVKAKGLKDKLLSTDSQVYDEGLSEFLMKYIDDGHTKYTGRSVFSGPQEVTSADLSNRYMGPRRGTLLAKRQEYVDYRKSILGEDVEQVGLFIEGETAVIRFDVFNHLLPLITDPGHAMDDFTIGYLMDRSTPFGFMRAFEEIEKHSEIKNVVYDLTCNGGGMVLTIPFLAAYFTKDPIICLRDNLAGVVREFHYDVDLNKDGVYHGEGDTFADKYHFYILTSDFSFSCGSALPTVAHIAGIDIIGTKCAGGACNVAGFSDACGSIYTLSAPQQIGYYDKDGNFINDDAGIPLTHEVSKEAWYDLTKLNQAIKGFSN